MKSTAKVEIVPVVLEKHPNADKLSVVSIFGFQCIVATESWQGITKAAYIPPDNIVKTTRPEFQFLAADAKVDGTYRIKAKKLRRLLSFGLLVPAPEGAEIGDNVAEQLEVVHYNPSVHRNSNRGGLFMSGEIAPAPNVYCTKYDLDAGRRYAAEVFKPGELVIITEKIHGCLEKNTPIALASGEIKPIHQVKSGDVVITYNELTKTFENKKVICQIVQPSDVRLRWIKITLANGKKLIVTDDHLFLTTDGWVSAGKLENHHDLVEYN